MPSLHRVARRSAARVEVTRVGGLAVLLALVAAAGPAAAQDGKEGPKGLTAQQYEGWRQYSAQCARCHGQDAIPNPVAANLLESLAPGGPMHAEHAFTSVVRAGRVEKGMPPFGKTLEPEQIGAIYSYLVGRASKKIPAGRPEKPGGK
jgi:mono/diheme cytochrome c family protein